ncbi:MAG: hypothetical protein JST60_18260 [Chloroflexi bacterium SZAS-1]|nr:hypothetical protein [Chloroflexi bacterium SZAS-1]HNP85643.1 hypothetical protein [Kouleothrix sp.]
MSYQYKRKDTLVTACDLCHDFSWVGDRRWRAMPHSTAEDPIHLCQACQRVALWCDAHRQYHFPESFHRHACADCGGLFTSVVRNALMRCPACRRAAGEGGVAAPPAPAKQVRSWVQLLFPPRDNQRREQR